MSLTTDPTHPDLGRGVDTQQVPQNKTYLVLSEEEIAKGFVRPVRNTYVHVGRYVGTGKPELLSESRLERFKGYNYVAEVKRDENYSTLLTQEDLNNLKNGYIGGCGVATTMGQELSETYATQPNFYGSTYCVGCSMHLGVEEFVWSGTKETVGS